MRVLKIKMDEEEHICERNRIRRAKTHSRVRIIEEEYSGDKSNCELSEILMLLRTPQKSARKGLGNPAGS